MKVSPEVKAKARAREAQFENAQPISSDDLVCVMLYLQAARDCAVISKSSGVHAQKYMLASIADAAEIFGYELTPIVSTMGR